MFKMRKILAVVGAVAAVGGAAVLWLHSPLGAHSNHLPGRVFIAPDSKVAVGIIADLKKLQGETRFVGGEFVFEHDPTPYEMFSLLETQLSTIPMEQIEPYSQFVELRDAYRSAVRESVTWRSAASLPCAALIAFCIVVLLRDSRVLR